MRSVMTLFGCILVLAACAVPIRVYAAPLSWFYVQDLSARGYDPVGSRFVWGVRTDLSDSNSVAVTLRRSEADYVMYVQHMPDTAAPDPRIVTLFAYTVVDAHTGRFLGLNLAVCINHFTCAQKIASRIEARFGR